jgi:hypothetical protein
LAKKPPRLRTAEDLLHKNEQIADGMERGVLTPKIAEQMGQCVKLPIALERLALSYLKMIAGMGKKATVPRSPLLRSMVGLNPDKLSPGDGEKVQSLLGESGD